MDAIRNVCGCVRELDVWERGVVCLWRCGCRGDQLAHQSVSKMTLAETELVCRVYVEAEQNRLNTI